jgi:DNA-binding MarR family transcriptional regulator
LAPRPHLDLSDYLPYLINRVGSALVTRFSEQALAGTHLNIATWRVLAALSNTAPLRQIDIAEITSTEVSTMSRLVTRLVHMGLVSRTRSRRSNREVVIDLTPKAAALVAQLIPIAEQLQATATRGLSRRDVTVLKRALRHMHENLTRARVGMRRGDLKRKVTSTNRRSRRVGKGAHTNTAPQYR